MIDDNDHEATSKEFLRWTSGKGFLKNLERLKATVKWNSGNFELKTRANRFTKRENKDLWRL